MKKTKYKALVIGDTFAAYGISQVILDCCIIEKTAQIGWEFISTFNYGKDWNSPCMTKPAVSLKEELLKRGILTSEGLVQCPALGPVMYQKVKDSQAVRLYMTWVSNIAKEDTGYRIELFHDGGFCDVFAECVIDTRGQYQALDEKQFRAVIDLPRPGMQMQSWRDDLFFIKSARNEICVVGVAANECTDISQARRKLHRIWQNRPAAFKEAKIAYTADAFFKEYPEEAVQEQNGITFLNSQAFDNPLKAVDAGYQWARSYLKHDKGKGAKG